MLAKLSAFAAPIASDSIRLSDKLSMAVVFPPYRGAAFLSGTLPKQRPGETPAAGRRPPGCGRNRLDRMPVCANLVA
jgi:hypothetical protein